MGPILVDKEAQFKADKRVVITKIENCRSPEELREELIRIAELAGSPSGNCSAIINSDCQPE